MAKANKTINVTIELDLDEARILRTNAHRQVRTPENLAKYLILSGLGFVDDRLYNPFSEAEIQAAVEQRIAERKAALGAVEGTRSHQTTLINADGCLTVATG